MTTAPTLHPVFLKTTLPTEEKAAVSRDGGVVGLLSFRARAPTLVARALSRRPQRSPPRAVTKPSCCHLRHGLFRGLVHLLLPTGIRYKLRYGKVPCLAALLRSVRRLWAAKIV